MRDKKKGLYSSHGLVPIKLAAVNIEFTILKINGLTINQNFSRKLVLEADCNWISFPPWPSYVVAHGIQS